MDIIQPEFRFSQVRPTRAVTSFDSAGNIDFDYRSNADEQLHLDKSFVNMRATLTKSAAWDFSCATYGATGIHTSTIAQKDSIAQNPMSCFFQTATLYINDQQVSKMSDVQVCTTAMKLCYNTSEEELNTLSPIVPYPYTDDYTAYDGADNATNGVYVPANGAHLGTNAKTFAGKKRVHTVVPEIDMDDIVPAASSTVIQVNLALPLYLFMQIKPEPLAGNAKLRLQLGIDAQYKQKILYTLSAHTLSTCVIDDLYLNLAHTRSLTGPPVSLNWSSDYMEVYTHVSKNENRALQLAGTAPSAKVVIISFQPTGAAVNILRNQHEGIFGQATPATNVFNSLYVTFAGRSFPNPQYNFPADFVRCYMDYKIFTNAHSTNSALTFREWLQSPFIVVHIESMPEDSDQLLTIFTDMKGTCVTNYDICVNVLYKKTLQLEYDEFAQPVQTIVADSK